MKKFRFYIGTSEWYEQTIEDIIIKIYPDSSEYPKGKVGLHFNSVYLAFEDLEKTEKFFKKVLEEIQDELKSRE